MYAGETPICRVEIQSKHTQTVTVHATNPAEAKRLARNPANWVTAGTAKRDDTTIRPLPKKGNGDSI